MRQVLCFGDSNTYGYVPGTAERYDWDTRWTGIVGTGLMEKGYICTGGRVVWQNHSI